MTQFSVHFLKETPYWKVANMKQIMFCVNHVLRCNLQSSSTPPEQQNNGHQLWKMRCSTS